MLMIIAHQIKDAFKSGADKIMGNGVLANGAGTKARYADLALRSGNQCLKMGGSYHSHLLSTLGLPKVGYPVGLSQPDVLVLFK